MIKMARKIVTVATIIRGVTEKEQSRIYETMRRLRKMGFKVVAADGGSPKDFIKRVRKLGVEVIERPGKPVGSNMKAAVKRAYDKGSDVIVYVEGDKISWPYALKKPVKLVVEEKADLVIPTRSRKTRKTMAGTQRFFETFGNVFQAIVAGKWTDALNGTRVMNRDVAKYFFEKGNTLKQWGADYWLLTRAARKGHKISKVTVHAPYPPDVGAKERLRFGGGTKLFAYRIKQEFGKGQVFEGILKARKKSIMERKRRRRR